MKDLHIHTKYSDDENKYGLYESYGSDFHGEHVKPNLKIGQIVKGEKLCDI